MNWFRWYHSTTTDPKLALVAHLSGQPMHLVIAVWAAMLEVASQAVPRGSIASFDPECQQVTLHTSQQQIERIIDVMTSKNMIDKHQIIAWNKRQCDPTSADRVRKYRERQKIIFDDVTNVTDVTVTPVTLRNVTPEEKRRDNTKPCAIDIAKGGFEEFWSNYPKKVGKSAAMKSWKQIRPDSKLQNEIARAVVLQKSSSQWAKNNGQFIPNPATWLNQGRWMDETEEVAEAWKIT